MRESGFCAITRSYRMGCGGGFAVLDLDPWLSPLDGVDPSGTSLRDDPRFHEIERLLQIGIPPADRNPVDWAQVMAGAEALRAEGRDLRLLVIVARAQTHERGLQGLADGLTLIARTIEAHWDTLHPDLRDAPAPRDAARRRISALMQLESDDDGLCGDLRRRTFFAVPALGPVRGRDLERSTIDSRTALNEPPRPGIGEKERATLVAEHEALVDRVRTACTALHDQSPAVLADLVAGMTAATAALGALEAALASRLGEPLQFRDLKQLLGRIMTALDRPAPARPDAPPAEAPALGAGATLATAAPISSVPAGLPDRLGSRQDVIACLDRIIEFYDRTEPASPVPYLARRMRRMVPMDFLQLMEDLAPSGIKEFRSLAGLTDDRKGPSRSQGENS